MEDLTPKRNKWYAEFFETVSTPGTNIDSDTRQVVAKENLPKPPRRKHKVTYEAKDLKALMLIFRRGKKCLNTLL